MIVKKVDRESSHNRLVILWYDIYIISDEFLINDDEIIE